MKEDESDFDTAAMRSLDSLLVLPGLYNCHFENLSFNGFIGSGLNITSCAHCNFSNIGF